MQKFYLNEAKQSLSSVERANNFEEFFKKYPDLKDVSTDVTEQQCYRSENYETQKHYYPGKKRSIQSKLK